MPTGEMKSTFEMPSTSGRQRLRFELVRGEEGPCLVGLYETAVYGDESLEPVPYTFPLPPVRTTVEDIAVMVEGFREHSHTMSSKEDQGEGVEFEFAGGHSLTLKLNPGGADNLCAGWQCVFSFLLSGPTVHVSGNYIVDATCLDIFNEGADSSVDLEKG